MRRSDPRQTNLTSLPGASICTGSERVSGALRTRASTTRVGCNEVEEMRVAVDDGRMAWRGVPLVVAQRVLGHAAPELTAKVYTHLDLADMRIAIEGVSEPRRARELVG